MPVSHNVKRCSGWVGGWVGGGGNDCMGKFFNGVYVNSQASLITLVKGLLFSEYIHSYMVEALPMLLSHEEGVLTVMTFVMDILSVQ